MGAYRNQQKLRKLTAELQCFQPLTQTCVSRAVGYVASIIARAARSGGVLKPSEKRS
jgi:hypothetical protein